MGSDDIIYENLRIEKMHQIGGRYVRLDTDNQRCKREPEDLSLVTVRKFWSLL